MSTNLKNRTLDRLIAELDLTECAIAIFRRGEPTRKGHPDGSNHKSSGCSIIISDADFSEFEQQVADAIECLTIDRDVFESIRYFDGVESMTLDFGVQRNRGSARFWHLSEELVRVAGAPGVAIETSSYPLGDYAESDQAEPPPKAT